MNLQISGQLVGMEARNGGWMAVGVQEVGAQYPKKLSTKKPELIQQAQSLMGQMVTAAYNEAEGNSINPHTGTPYINRYLEALALGQVQQAQTAAQPQLQQQTQMVQQAQTVAQPIMQTQPMVQTQPQTASTFQPVPMTDARTEQIHRQTASKVAVSLLPHLAESERTLTSIITISESLCKYYRDGVPWTVAPVAQPQTQEAPPPDPGQDYGDVPF